MGGVLTDLAQFVGEAVFAAGMTAKTSAAGVSLLIKYYEADGQPYTKELPLPVGWLSSIDLTDNGIIEVFKKEITAVEQQMKAIIKATPELKRVYDILTSFKGIGLINAVALIVATDNFQRFDFDARKICSYWGVAPFACQSGTSLNGKPHVSGYADRYLKSLLSEAALTAMQFCPAIRDYAMRLRARGKHRAIIANNCKNKMLHILVAIVKNGTRYGEQKNDDAA